MEHEAAVGAMEYNILHQEMLERVDRVQYPYVKKVPGFAGYEPRTKKVSQRKRVKGQRKNRALNVKRVEVLRKGYFCRTEMKELQTSLIDLREECRSMLSCCKRHPYIVPRLITDKLRAFNHLLDKTLQLPPLYMGPDMKKENIRLADEDKKEIESDNDSSSDFHP